MAAFNTGTVAAMVEVSLAVIMTTAMEEAAITTSS